MNYAYAVLYWDDMEILHKKCHVSAEIRTELTYLLHGAESFFRS